MIINYPAAGMALDELWTMHTDRLPSIEEILQSTEYALHAASMQYRSDA